MFRCYSYTIIRERINLCLLKLQLLKQSITIHRCVVNTVVVWLRMLCPYWCVCCTDGVTVTPKRVGAVLMYILILFFKTTHWCISW